MIFIIAPLKGAIINIHWSKSTPYADLFIGLNNSNEFLGGMTRFINCITYKLEKGYGIIHSENINIKNYLLFRQKILISFIY